MRYCAKGEREAASAAMKRARNVTGPWKATQLFLVSQSCPSRSFIKLAEECWCRYCGCISLSSTPFGLSTTVALLFVDCVCCSAKSYLRSVATPARLAALAMSGVACRFAMAAAIIRDSGPYSARLAVKLHWRGQSCAPNPLVRCLLHTAQPHNFSPCARIEKQYP
jgi:hypothetical protein